MLIVDEMFCNSLTTVLGSFSFLNYFLALALGWIIYRWASHRWLKLPPGPLGLPIVGVIPYLEMHAEKTLAAWTKTYGPIMLVDIGSTRNVVLNSYEAIEEVTNLTFFHEVLQWS